MENAYKKESGLTSPNFDRIKRLKGGANLGDITKMINYGIASAKKHGIVLVPGIRNNADGNCTFEAVIDNINHRHCFVQKFCLHPNLYRQRWITETERDSENHPVLGALFSEEEKRINWNTLKSPYVYEVPFFGDYVIHGIAKGCQKDILIFNTSPAASEAIHVIRASEFNGEIDTDIPVVLCYNQSHYESLHPLTQEDIEKNKLLVQVYINGSYSFKKEDIPFLIGIRNVATENVETSSENDKTLKQNNKQVLIKPLKETQKGKCLNVRCMTIDEKRKYERDRYK